MANLDSSYISKNIQGDFKDYQEIAAINQAQYQQFLSKSLLCNFDQVNNKKGKFHYAQSKQDTYKEDINIIQVKQIMVEQDKEHQNAHQLFVEPLYVEPQEQKVLLEQKLKSQFQNYQGSDNFQLLEQDDNSSNSSQEYEILYSQQEQFELLWL